MLQGQQPSDNALSLRSPAKLNLFLRILGKRADGYHELASLFQAIDLFDTLIFTLSEKDSFTCSDPSLPVDQTNLVLKAVKLFREKTGKTFPLSIHLDKKIPSQAGLGGGSSNAATTLFALNKLAKTNLSDAQLANWSQEIGSDIPFFFSLGTAYCKGRGEIVRHLQPLEGKNISIFKPDIGLSTPAVFAALDLKALKPRNPENLLQNFYEGRPEYVNDLEEAALRVLPSLNNYKQSLENQGVRGLHMTGSGSAFFSLENPKIESAYYLANHIVRLQGQWY